MPDDVRTDARDRRVERALEFLNAEPTEDLLTSRSGSVGEELEYFGFNVAAGRRMNQQVGQLAVIGIDDSVPVQAVVVEEPAS